MIPRLGTHSRPQMSETGAATRNGEICGFSLSPLAADGNGIGGSDMIKCTRYAIISIRKELRGRPLTLYHELDSTLVAKKKGADFQTKVSFLLRFDSIFTDWRRNQTNKSKSDTSMGGVQSQSRYCAALLLGPYWQCASFIGFTSSNVQPTLHAALKTGIMSSLLLESIRVCCLVTAQWKKQTNQFGPLTSTKILSVNSIELIEVGNFSVERNYGSCLLLWLPVLLSDQLKYPLVLWDCCDLNNQCLSHCDAIGLHGKQFVIRNQPLSIYVRCNFCACCALEEERWIGGALVGGQNGLHLPALM